MERAPALADLRRVRGSLALALGLVAAGAVALAGALRMLGAEQALNDAAQAQQRELQARLARVRDEERALRQGAARFEALVARGIVGEEQRAQWIEQMRRIRAERRLFDLRYEIAAQRPLEGAADGALDYRASAMHLRLEMLHENDLLGFLSDLRAAAKASLLVRRCDVARQAPYAGADAPQAPALAAECEIDWVTLRAKEAAS